MGDQDETRRRKVRAAWAYSGDNQKELAEAAGMTYDRLRVLLARSTNRGDPVTLDELYALAEAAGIDRSFMNDDFGTEEVSITELRESVAELVAQTAQHQRALAELQAWRHRQGPSASDGSGDR